MYSSPIRSGPSMHRARLVHQVEGDPGMGRRRSGWFPPATSSGVSSTWVTAMVVSVGPYRLKTRIWGAASQGTGGRPGSWPRRRGPRRRGAATQLLHLRAGQQQSEVAGREPGVGDALLGTALKKVRGNSSASRGRMTTAPPAVQGREQGAERTVEVERGHAQRPGGPVEAEGVDVASTAAAKAPVADEHPLGCAGGTRGVDGIDGSTRCRLRREGPVTGAGRAQGSEPDPPGRWVEPRGVGRLLLVVSGHHQHRRAVGQDAGQPGVGVGDRQRDEDGADPQGRPARPPRTRRSWEAAGPPGRPRPPPARTMPSASRPRRRPARRR